MSTARHYIHVGPTMFYQGGSRSLSEWEMTVKQLMDEGQFFLAYDLAKTALNQFPESIRLKQFAARALYQTGGIDEARKILEPLCPKLQPDKATLLRIYTKLRKALGLKTNTHPSKEALKAIGELFQEIGGAGDIRERPSPDEETLGLLARVYKDIWKRSGNPNDAHRSRDAYLRAFRMTGGYWTGINAATMSWLIGEEQLAQDLARQVLGVCQVALNNASEEERYWIKATIGEANLLLKDEEKAVGAYQEAEKLAGGKYAQIVSSLQQLKLMAKHGFCAPPELFDILKPPTVVIFAGHMIDREDRSVPRFPPDLETAVRIEIDQHLKKLDARIGYCSAACGSDILFIEAMADRDAEVNIVLPFDMEDFAKKSVEYAGERWLARFRRAIKLANSVKYVTEEQFLGDEILFAFGGQIFHGYAELRAHTLETTPYLIAVWDGDLNVVDGGTADIVSRWPDKERLQVIRIDKLRSAVPTPAPSSEKPDRIVLHKDSNPPPQAPHPCKRVIKTILFADIVGYSKLEEKHTPFYMYEFLERIADNLKGINVKPEFINTWGDAIFVVMDEAMPMAEYALALRNAVCTTDWTNLGLPAQMSVRIALHAGPVFEGKDPLMGKINFYGSHVNRAARIEPVTVPGCVYASEQFAALLTTEQTAAKQEAASGNQPPKRPFACEYVGTLSLAKNFGPQAVYRIRRT